MTRVKNSVATRARRKKVLKRAKGYFGSKHRLFKTAQEQVMHSERYAFRDRKQKKRDFRKLWITRINAGCRENGISYSRFIDGLNKAGVEVNRKMLSELAIYDKEAFANLVKVAKEGKVVVKPVKKETTKKEAPTPSAKKETKTK
jgi:large subunit ribosomal protein L20